MQRRTTRLSIAMIMLTLFAGAGIVQAALFQPLPHEDKVKGRNSYAYNPAIGHPTYDEQITFIDTIKDAAITTSATYGIPASAIIGMACVEGGYGFTRSAYFANNIFGIKVWAQNPANGWQLKGQPDENEGRVPVIASFGKDRRLFNEAIRYDNWYRKFATRAEAINYLGGLISRKYQSAQTNYQKHIAAGWSYAKASKEFCREIADLGYNHLGGDYYEKKIGAVMDRWNLYQYDGKSGKTGKPAKHRRIKINISID